MGYEKFNVDGDSVSAWQVAKLLAFEQATPNKKVGFLMTLKQLGNAINLINGKDVPGVMTRADLEQRKVAFVPKDNFNSSKREFSQTAYVTWKENRAILEDDFDREHYDGEEYENPLFNGISSDQFAEDDSEEDEELADSSRLGEQQLSISPEEGNIRLSTSDRLACKANLETCQKQLEQLRQQVEQLKTDSPGKNWDRTEQEIASKLQDCRTNLDKAKQWSYKDFNSIDTLAKCHIEIADKVRVLVEKSDTGEPQASDSSAIPLVPASIQPFGQIISSPHLSTTIDPVEIKQSAEAKITQEMHASIKNHYHGLGELHSQIGKDLMPKLVSLEWNGYITKEQRMEFEQKCRSLMEDIWQQTDIVSKAIEYPDYNNPNNATLLGTRMAAQQKADDDVAIPNDKMGDVYNQMNFDMLEKAQTGIAQLRTRIESLKPTAEEQEAKTAPYRDGWREIQKQIPERMQIFENLHSQCDELVRQLESCELTDPKDIGEREYLVDHCIKFVQEHIRQRANELNTLNDLVTSGLNQPVEFPKEYDEQLKKMASKSVLDVDSYVNTLQDYSSQVEALLQKATGTASS